MNKTIKLATLKEKLGWNNLNIIEPVNGYTDSYTTYKEDNKPTFVEPFFSLQSGSLEEKIDMLLISAVGAAGKTQLSEYLSLQTGAPILDLAKHEPVGGYSFTGLLSRRYNYQERLSRIKEGKQLIIIDGLDEGLMKVTRDAFFSFINDIMQFAQNNTPNTTIVLLGRTLVMGEVASHLKSNNFNAPLLKIEPFTEEQAEEFLYKKVIGANKVRYTKPYQDVIKYLINSIKGFFKNQGELDKATFNNFIGYAPVLDAIAELLKGNSNYHALLKELESEQYTNVNLLIHLLEKILKREQNKVRNAVIAKLLENYPTEQRDFFDKVVYSGDDQCRRLLSICLGEEYTPTYNDDESFSIRFDKQLGDMRYEHPFLTDRRINNVVFESYILAKAALSEDTYEAALKYMKNSSLFKNSFAFYPVFMNIIKEKEVIISDEFFPALYDSLSSQSSSILKTRVEINQDECEPINLNVSLENSEYGTEDCITMFLHNVDDFTVGASLGNTTIMGDFDVTLSGRHVVLNAPVEIDCRILKSKCSELSLLRIYEKENPGNNNHIYISCQELCTIVDDQGHITNLKHSDCDFYIRSNKRPAFPFSQFYSGIPIDKKDPDYLKFQKLRRIILQFRGHKRGELAKMKDKILNRNAYGIGRSTVNALVANGIIYERNHLYVIDEDKFMKILGMSYDNMINSEINDKVRKFLCSY